MYVTYPASVMFQGVKYSRRPASKIRRLRVYYWPSTKGRDAGREVLHRDIYKSIYGSIPKGYVIHHRDLNSLNNDPKNLIAMTEADHMALHAALAPAGTRLRRLWTQRIRRVKAKQLKRIKEARYAV